MKNYAKMCSLFEVVREMNQEVDTSAGCLRDMETHFDRKIPEAFPSTIGLVEYGGGHNDALALTVEEMIFVSQPESGYATRDYCGDSERNSMDLVPEPVSTTDEFDALLKEVHTYAE